MDWNREAEEKFCRMILMVPVPHRRKAENQARLKAEEMALGRGAAEVGECDIVTAFIKETPAYLQGWMREKAKKVGFNLEVYA